MDIYGYEVGMIRLGYAGSNTELPSASKTFRIVNYTEERMLETTRNNLQALKNILEWNISHGISVFRITSCLVPYASSTINSGSWKTTFRETFMEIGEKIIENNLAVSLHPGQYTVLNSPVESVYKTSLSDLDYHSTVFELMGLSKDSKIIVHCGGKYDDKERSLTLFFKRFEKLPGRIKDRIAIENDERVCDTEDIYRIHKDTGAPCVFDVFHNEILKNPGSFSERQIILRLRNTWGSLRQKIHYSNQDPLKQKGAHSETVDISKFAEFYNEIKDLELDIMLEVKDKQNSVLKLREVFPELK
jgi:UV DNA damage endonuclease